MLHWLYTRQAVNPMRQKILVFCDLFFTFRCTFLNFSWGWILFHKFTGSQLNISHLRPLHLIIFTNFIFVLSTASYNSFTSFIYFYLLSINKSNMMRLFIWRAYSYVCPINQSVSEKNMQQPILILELSSSIKSRRNPLLTQYLYPAREESIPHCFHDNQESWLLY